MTLRQDLTVRQGATWAFSYTHRDLAGAVVDLSCAFQGSWAPVPRDRGHSFHGIVGSHSTRSWAAGLTDRFIDSGLLSQVKA